jgi:hypothetical protein
MPPNLSTDSNHPRQRQKRTSSSQARGRSNLSTVELRNRVVRLRNTDLSDDPIPFAPDDSSGKTPGSSVHRAPMTAASWMDSPVTDSLAHSIVKSDAREADTATKDTAYSDAVGLSFSAFVMSSDLLVCSI